MGEEQVVLRSSLKKAVRCLLGDGGPSPLTPEACRQLLLEVPEDSKASDAACKTTPCEQSDQTVNGAQDEASGLHLVKGYPSVPLYVRLSDCITHWMLHKRCPSLSLPAMFMLNEEASDSERQKQLEVVGKRVEQLHKEWGNLSEEAQIQKLVEILNLLGLRGVLDMLGVRCTVGSCPLLPPSRHALLASFTRQHHPKAKLSVGGRALSKHCHRDGTHQWWGLCTGSEAQKNEHALEVALRILNAAVWINIHTLPHDVQVLEVRVEEGYGLRWLSDGSEFRGFLEPQMPDGHAAGWRH